MVTSQKVSEARWAFCFVGGGPGEARQGCAGPGEAWRDNWWSREGPAPDEEGPRLS
jgi:hypothetical protein